METVPPASQQLLDSVVDIAREAGDVTLKWFRSSTLRVDRKFDGTVVTEADLATERYVRERIGELAPGSTIVGEEEGSSQGADGGLVWYVDPIDGTKGFARGVPLYSVLIAVEDEHGPAVGVVAIPATGEMVWAGRGLGACTPDGPARVSETKALGGAFISTSAVSRWGTGVIGRALDANVDIRGWGDGYGFLMAATGRVDAMVDLGAGKPWDNAPWPVIFTEAGGRYSDASGSSNIHASSAVATNGLLHDEVLRIVNG